MAAAEARHRHVPMAAEARRRVAAEARRRRWRPKRGAADGGRSEAPLMASDRRRVSTEVPPRGNVKFRATCSSSEREMWRVDEI